MNETTEAAAEQLTAADAPALSPEQKAALRVLLNPEAKEPAA